MSSMLALMAGVAVMVACVQVVPSLVEYQRVPVSLPIHRMPAPEKTGPQVVASSVLVMPWSRENCPFLPISMFFDSRNLEALASLESSDFCPAPSFQSKCAIALSPSESRTS
jgi:hypothetical protein